MQVHGRLHGACLGLVALGIALAGVAFVYANLRGRKRRRTEADREIARDQWGEEEVR
jgi:hypothetical protein